MSDLKFLSDETLQQLLPYDEIVAALRTAFKGKYQVPLRHHHDFQPPANESPSTLLLMPAWDEQVYFGVKIVSVSPENAKKALPSIHGIYILFEQATGRPVLQCDARLLTALRTASASALASSYLSRPASSTLLMIGTGALAPHLIRAHASVRPLSRVIIWGRNEAKAQQLSASFAAAKFEVEVSTDLAQSVPQADIISCATLSKTPLVCGRWLRAGQHLDLVGSYRPDMREADDEACARSSIYVDTLEGALRESGDIVIPIKNGIFKASDVQTDLFGMCQQTQSSLRKGATEITLFKSVGHALEDLATAVLAFGKYQLFALFLSAFFLACTPNSVPESTIPLAPKTPMIKNYFQAKQASQAPKIDGIADDACWQNSTWYPIDQLWLGAPTTPEDFTGRYTLSWSEDWLFLTATITDDSLMDYYSNGLENYYKDDCFEVFVDENHSGGDHAFNYNAFAYHIAKDLKVVDIGPDSLPHYYDHVDLQRSRSENTYTWEMAIRVYNDQYRDRQENIPVKLSKGKKMGFVVAYCDNDQSTDREHFFGGVIIEGADKNLAWKDANVFGTLELVE